MLDIPGLVPGFLFLLFGIAMPPRPKSICRHPGCGRLIDSTGYCERHQKADKERKAISDKRRQSSNERGYTFSWHKIRTLYLQANPLCAICEKKGHLTAATCVDHIIPHRGDDALMWDESNFQSLCQSCHSRKTAKEDGGFGNKISDSR